MSRSSINTLKQRGFTVVELIVVITVMGILSAVLFTSFDDIYTSGYRTLGNTTQVNDARSLLRSIQSDLTASNGFLPAPSILDPAGPPSGGLWSHAGPTNSSDNRVLIASTYATTKPSSDDTRSLVYIADSALGTCDADTTSNPVLKNNLIYFVKDTTLYRRTVVADSTITPRCAGYEPIQKQTCPVGYTNTRCQGTDALLLQNVEKFEIDYYSAPESTTPVASIYTNPLLLDETVTTISIKITTGQKINGKNNSYTASLRISHR